jgi:hypothetical protein
MNMNTVPHITITDALVGSKCENYTLGYLRAKADMQDMMKLAKFGAEVLKDSINYASVDFGDVCVTAAKLDLLTDLGVIPPAIEATIEQLLKD